MCLGMNPDILKPGERCASTSNRNFEGRQGRGGRTHLVSPMMAAAAALRDTLPIYEMGVSVMDGPRAETPLATTTCCRLRRAARSIGYQDFLI